MQDRIIIMTKTQEPCSTSGLPGYDEAIDRVLNCVPELPTQLASLESAGGRWLKETITADRDQPPFNRSAMDGFAVKSDAITIGLAYDVAGVIAAGAPDEVVSAKLPAGKVARIATGASLPPGADATIPIELAEVETDADGNERVRFTGSPPSPWQHIHKQASDAREGDTVLSLPRRLRSQHIGIAAAVGKTELTVSRRPRIVVMSTGDEVRPFGTKTDALGPQQIRNSNAPMLHAILEQANADLVRMQHILDEPGPTRDAATQAIDDADLVITIGGVSVGQRDLLPATWRELGAETILHGVALQPGKPVLVAQKNKTLILGLPGNPVSVLVTAQLFLLPILNMLASADASHSKARWISCRLATPIKAKASREVIRPIQIEPDGRVSMLQWQGSGDLMHTAPAEGLARLPLIDAMVPENAELPVLFL